MPQFLCVGVPYFIGERIEARTEVARLRENDFIQEIGAEWVDLAPDFDRHDDPVVAVNQSLVETINRYPNHIPIVLAADCVSAIGTLRGLYRPDIGVVWYDAHGDFNTEETTPSGFLGGMPLAMLVGRGRQLIMQGVGLAPLPEEHIIITDARDLDPEEGENLRASKLVHLPDIEDLMTAPLPAGPIYIHLDVDVVDPAEIGGMSYPAPGGPSIETTARTLERVAREGQVVGLLASLWNEALAEDDQPLEGTLALLRAFVRGMDDG